MRNFRLRDYDFKSAMAMWLCLWIRLISRLSIRRLNLTEVWSSFSFIFKYEVLFSFILLLLPRVSYFSTICFNYSSFFRESMISLRELSFFLRLIGFTSKNSLIASMMRSKASGFQFIFRSLSDRSIMAGFIFVTLYLVFVIVRIKVLTKKRCWYFLLLY